MLRQITAVIVVAASVAASCADSPRLAPAHDRAPELAERPEPQLFASGTVTWGAADEAFIDWDLEEIIGFSHAISLTADSGTTVSVRSVSRQGATDQVWLIGTTLTDEGPAMVFGGADGAIDAILLVNAEGEELPLDLIKLPERDWNAMIEQVPPEWSLGHESDVEVIALRSGSEIAREPLDGLLG